MSHSVAVVVPHHLTRAGVVRVLADAADLRVTAHAASPDVLDGGPVDVLVAGVPGPGGAELVRRLSDRGRVLVLADATYPVELAGALRAGACGYLANDVDEAQLLVAVRAVASGACYVSPMVAGQLRAAVGGAEPGTVPCGLGPREAETLRLLARGLTHRQIGRRLGLTESTVSTYVKRIRAKLGAGNKAELTRMAVELGYLELPARRAG